MNSKNCLLIGLFFAACSMAISQSAPDLNKPLPHSDMPTWASLMYENPVNLYKLDSAYKSYYSKFSFEKNAYTRYYKRLIMMNRMYLNPDGFIVSRNERVFENNRQVPTSKNRNSMPSWSPINMETFWLEKPKEACPWQVNVYAVDLCKSNPSFMIAASETGGIYQTKDKGKNWNQVGHSYNLETKALAIHPNSTDTIYLGTSGAIRRSVDGGNNWTTVFTFQDITVHDLEILSSSPQTILAATSQGLFRSINSGQVWTRIFNEASCDVKANPANNNIVYTLRFNNTLGYYEPVKSSNAGASFILKNSGWHNLKDGGVKIAVTPANSNRVYAIVLTNDRGPYLMRSDNAGESWTISAKGNYQGYTSPEFPMDNWQGFYDLAIIASNSNADHLITGTGSIFKSTNGGRNFSIHGGYGGNFSVHPDFQCAVGHGNDYWIGTDGGLTYSVDFFTDVAKSEARNKGLNGSDFWGFDVGWNQKTVAGGRYHNGNTVYSKEFQEKFIRMGGAEQSTGYIHPIRNHDLYFSDIGAYSVSQKNDSSMNWTEIPCAKYPNESYYPMEFSKMVWSPVCYSTVYLGEKNTLWISQNNAASFTALFTLPDADSWVEDIEISRSNPDVIYFSERNNRRSDGHIWKSEDAGKTFQKLSTPQGSNGGMRRVKAISLSDTDSKVIFQGLRTGNSQNKIFKSEDGGQNWTNLTTTKISNLNISDIIYQNGTQDGVYIACDGGQIFYRNKNMPDWELHGTGLSVSHFTRALKPYYKENKLVNGSNHGVWEIDLFESSKPIAQPSVDKQSSYCHRDTFYFEDYSTLFYDGTEKYKWEFPNALYVSDPYSKNPKVVYSAAGSYNVSLEISNNSGSSKKTVNNMITVFPSICNPDTVSGNSLDLVASGNSLNIPPIPALHQATGFTVMAWIKLHKKQDCFTQIISNWGSNVGFGFGFAFQGYVPTTNLTFFWKDVPYQLTSPFNLDTLVWTHVAMVVYPDSIRLYRDGVGWTRRGNFGDFDLSKTAWEVGKGVPGQCGDFNGEIEELKLYNRSLNQDEIRKNMHLIQPNENNLVAYYQFNEENKNIFYNKIGISHAANNNGQTIPSTAPVSAGLSQEMNNLKIGWNSANETGVQIHLQNNPASQTRMYSYFLRQNPTPQADSVHAPFLHGYWITRYWENNQIINLDSIRFKSAFPFDASAAAQNARFKLFRRNPANAHLQSWNYESNAIAANVSSQEILFQNNGSVQSQWMLSRPDILLGNKNERLQNAPFNVYPNPSNGVWTIWSDNAKDEMYVEDLNGQTFLKIKAPFPYELHLGNYPSGIYILRQTDQFIKLIKL